MSDSLCEVSFITRETKPRMIIDVDMDTMDDFKSKHGIDPLKEIVELIRMELAEREGE